MVARLTKPAEKPELSLEELLAEAGGGISKRTAWRWIRQGLIPEGKRIPGRGNAVYFPHEAIERVQLVHDLLAYGLPAKLISDVFSASGDEKLIRIIWKEIRARRESQHHPKENEK